MKTKTLFLFILLSSVLRGTAQTLDKIPEGFLVACGEDQVIMIDPAKGEDSTAIVWSWKVSESKGQIPDIYQRLLIPFDDCKPIDANTKILLTSSGGATAILNIRTRKIEFYAQTPMAHSADLLPGGYIAVANSTHKKGNSLELYDRKKPETVLSKDTLYSGHGVVWNHHTQRAYVLGFDELRTYQWDASGEKLTLENRVPLPSNGGHDLSLMGINTLLVTTHDHVYTYSISDQIFDYFDLLDNVPHVKSANYDPGTGKLVYTKAEESWWTFNLYGKNPDFTIHIPSVRLYKVRTVPKNPSEIRKIKDIVIYSDSSFYSCFPSVIRKPDGEFLLAFRRAPNRILFGEKGNSHTDHNSYLVGLRSADGEHWTEEPELIYAHPFGGSQDPCLLQLKNGTILCTSYGWQRVHLEARKSLKQPYFGSDYIFLGGYLVRSLDGGQSWKEAIYPLSVPAEINYNVFGDEVPAYNRGALHEARDGRILWIVAAHDSPGKTSNYLITSRDGGLTWEYTGEVARDSSVSFNEASVIETPNGDIVGFLRTAHFDDQAVIARSQDGGKTFEWQSMGFQGHPLNALRLADGRVLITYGYRHQPYGIRARILNAECTDFDTAPEIVLRDDGGTSDLGYTWPVQLDDNRVLVTYYFNKENGIRHIAGTILEID